MWSRLTWLQMLFAVRGVNRWRNERSSNALRMPSIHPQHSAMSSACACVTVGEAGVLLVDLEPDLGLAIVIGAQPDLERGWRGEGLDLFRIGNHGRHVKPCRFAKLRFIEERQTARNARRREMPDGAKCQTARNARRREMPNGAKCRTARNAGRREMPNGARCQTARNARRREMPDGARCRDGAKCRTARSAFAR